MGRVGLSLHGLRTDLEGATSRALALAGTDAKKRYGLVATRAGGGDARLSGVGRRAARPGSGGRRIGAGWDYEKGSRGLTVAVYATGPWQLVEYGRRGGYRIPRARGTGPNREPGRRNAPRLRLAGGGWVTGPVKGRAAPGRRWWNTNTPGVLDEMGDAMLAAWVKVLDGW